MRVRRDGEGHLSGGPSWESITERIIREAIERGDFDGLPFQGERIPIEDDTLAGDNRLGFHVLRNAGVAPPWIEADKDVRRLLDERDRVLARAAIAHTSIAQERLRRQLAEAVQSANAAIARLNTEAPSAGQHRRFLRLDAEMAELERRMQAG